MLTTVYRFDVEISMCRSQTREGQVMSSRIVQGFFPSGQARVPVTPGLPDGRPPRSGPATMVQRASNPQRSSGTDNFHVDPARLGLVSGGGRPLADTLRSKMEAALGADFSAVRVHVGPQAERIGALAFTTGTDIYFAPGRYQPESAHGQQLIGHELAHVIQQRQGRVRGFGDGVTVVQDRSLEAEADHLARRASSWEGQNRGGLHGNRLQARMDSGKAQGAGEAVQRARSGVQAGMQAGSFPQAAQRRPSPVGDRATIQAKGGKYLQSLATPRTFKGPEVEIQKALVAKIEGLVATRAESEHEMSYAVICLGGVLLPTNLNVSRAELVKRSLFVKVPNPSVIDKYYRIAANTEIQDLIKANTISTMIAAGQIEYLKQAGLGGDEWAILVEVHYYRNRFQTTPQLHKDTKGQTLFVNLNYANEEEIAGPEFVVNPTERKEHRQQIKNTLPTKYLRHVKKAKANLPDPTEIGASVIPRYGVVSFVDELIHHATPLLRSRTKPIRADKLDEYLQGKYPTEYAKAVAAYDAYQRSGYSYAVSATVGSWLASFVSSSELERRKWYEWIQMTKSGRTFDKLVLQQKGFSATELDEMLQVDPDYAEGFETASVPSTNSNNAWETPVPRLARRMSMDLSRAQRFKAAANAKGAPPRRFFRTWVRAVPRAHLLA